MKGVQFPFLVIQGVDAITLNLALLETLRHIRNYFISGFDVGDFEIKGSAIITPNITKYPKGTWIIISGSNFNDGIYKVVSDVRQLGDGANNPLTLEDETFIGIINTLRFPAGFLNLVKEIHTWRTDEANAASNVVSESEGVAGSDKWSVTRAVGRDGKPLTWEDVFASRLNPFRKMFAKEAF